MSVRATVVVICRLFILIGIAGVYVSILLSNSLCLFYFVLWAAFLLFFFLNDLHYIFSWIYSSWGTSQFNLLILSFSILYWVASALVSQLPEESFGPFLFWDFEFRISGVSFYFLPSSVGGYLIHTEYCCSFLPYGWGENFQQLYFSFFFFL